MRTQGGGAQGLGDWVCGGQGRERHQVGLLQVKKRPRKGDRLIG